MGFFKSAKNYLTGGSAELHVEVGEAFLGDSMPIRIVCRVKDTAINIKDVYLKIKAVELEEEIEITHYRDGSVRFDEDYDKDTTYKDRIEVDGEQTLEANEEYTWEGEVDLPGNHHPTIYDDGFAHQWFILAGLSAAGNDPDSGWLEFEVQE